jgi:hypothetical protein
MERGCLAAVGVASVLVSGFFVAGAVVEVASGGDGKTQPAAYAALIAFFGGLLVAGAYLTWRMVHQRQESPAAARPAAERAAPQRAEADRERRVLRVAQKEHGRVTIPEVATHCDMTIAEAKATLDRLVLSEVAEIRVTERGVLVYVFPGFLSEKEKESATDF